MTPEQQEAQWRNRFILLNVARIGGTILTLFALLLWQSDLFVPGGADWAFPLVLIGLAISFGGPLYLARKWRTPPGP
jgi:hypothetical protein